MTTVSVEEIKALREQTGLSISLCQKALEEAAGDSKKAVEILRAQGAAIAQKKSDRTLKAGTVVAYVHSGDVIGVLLELLCETDFVAKNPEFKSVAKDIAMHVAAMNPENTEQLLEQPFIKEPEKKIVDLINGTVQKFGERTEIGRFTRFSIK